MRPLLIIRAILLVSALSLIGGCGGPGSDRTPTGPRNGMWRMVLDLGEEDLPFLFEVDDDGDGWVISVFNGEERIAIRDVEVRQDTLHVRMPLYDSEFRGILHNDSLFSGHWYNHLKGPDYAIPFTARAAAGERFPGELPPTTNVSGNWHVNFSASTPDAYEALGIFQQDVDGRATGTFVTETGDYRFLEGAVHGDSLVLSCFDGSHAFLFKARMAGDSLVGSFWSGVHWQEPWVAVRDPGFHLRDPDSLTFLKEGYDMIEFRFPDLHGDSISPKDPRYMGKVLLVQVMGSWCPNCVDETRLLTELYREHHDAGLEVIAVAFEKHADPAQALDALVHFRDALAVPYAITYAGMAAKEEAARKLPFLDHVMSYPTCIFVDRKGKVRRIRTGFYGPGTGEHYVNYRRNLEAFLQEMLQVAPPSAVATR